jgi:hypothetical protein
MPNATRYSETGQQARQRSPEQVYIVKQEGDAYVITGTAERKAAEAQGLCHLTVIIVAFVADGEKKGCWLLHDRTAKLWAKGDKSGKSPSWNFFGGHAVVSEGSDVTGTRVSMRIFRDTAERELNEELMRMNGTQTELALWGKQSADGKTDLPPRIIGTMQADPYPVKPENLLPIGYATYTGKNNVEVSFVYALPIPSRDVPALIAADDYESNSEKHNIALPIRAMTEHDLKRAAQEEPHTEICDAVTRLWEKENAQTYNALMNTIANRRETS